LKSPFLSCRPPCQILITSSFVSTSGATPRSIIRHEYPALNAIPNRLNFFYGPYLINLGSNREILLKTRFLSFDECVELENNLPVRIGCLDFAFGSGLSFAGDFFLASAFELGSFLSVFAAAFFRDALLAVPEPMMSSKSASSSTADQQAVLRLADNIEHFLSQLRKTADTLNVIERQKVLRLVVKEILVDDKTITIKHSIPFSNSSIAGDSNQMPEIPGYLLRSWRHQSSFGEFVHEPISEILAG